MRIIPANNRNFEDVFKIKKITASTIYLNKISLGISKNNYFDRQHNQIKRECVTQHIPHAGSEHRTQQSTEIFKHFLSSYSTTHFTVKSTAFCFKYQE